MNQLVYMLFLLCLTMATPKLFKIQQRFEENVEKFSTIPLPKITEEKTFKQELQLFGKMQKEKDFLYFKPNPQLSSQILLKKENSWSQSLFFVGKQVSSLIIEIGVTHHEGITAYQNQSIEVYLINCEDSQVVLGERVKHLQFFKVDVLSVLYELRVSFNWEQIDNSSKKEEEQTEKHVKISMDIVVSGAKIENQTNQDSIKTFDKLSSINQDTNRIFMSSLQIWDEVQNHHQQHFLNQENVYTRALWQLIFVCFINIVQLLLLKKTLKIQSLI